MTIDKAIKILNDSRIDCFIIGDETINCMIEMLEELKCYRNENNFSEYADRLYKKAYNKALDDFADKLKSKPYWDDEHNFQAIPIDFIDEVLDEMKC